MFNLEALLLDVFGLSSMVSLVSWIGLNLFTLVFPCFQSLGNFLDFSVLFSTIDAVQYKNTLSNLMIENL